MELRIPKCALKGLRLEDVIFNDQNCALIATEEDGFFNWSIDYNDCGMERHQNGTKITYSNLLRTKLDMSGSVYPNLPIFEGRVTLFHNYFIYRNRLPYRNHSIAVLKSFLNMYKKCH